MFRRKPFKPSEEVLRLASGVKGVFKVNDSEWLPVVPAIAHILSLLKKGKTATVVWAPNHQSKPVLTAHITDIEDLERLLEKIRSKTRS